MAAGTGAVWFAAGAVLAALAVAAGAFGAHGLEGRLEPRALALWETAARYLMYGGLGLLATGLAAHHQGRGGALAVAGWCLLAGSLVFSGTVAALALGAPRWLGAVTPLGGLALIAGFAALAVSAVR
jgi:uncharacterized membrane protein YgdD (TMEM256/DUF423 family)